MTQLNVLYRPVQEPRLLHSLQEVIVDLVPFFSNHIRLFYDEYDDLGAMQPTKRTGRVIWSIPPMTIVPIKQRGRGREHCCFGAYW